jgi:hypothetical protein
MLLAFNWPVYPCCQQLCLLPGRRANSLAALLGPPGRLVWGVYSAGARGLGRRTRKRVSDAKFWVRNHAAGLISEIALGLSAPVER